MKKKVNKIARDVLKSIIVIEEVVEDVSELTKGERKIISVQIGSIERRLVKLKQLTL